MTVRFKGLKQLDRDLGKANKDLRKGLRRDLKDIADIVAVGAKAKAEPFRKSGDMIRGIKPFALTGKAGVRSNSLHHGYSYPSRLEWEGGKGRGNPGPRASLLPAFEEAKPVVLAECEQLLDRLADDFHH